MGETRTSKFKGNTVENIVTSIWFIDSKFIYTVRRRRKRRKDINIYVCICDAFEHSCIYEATYTYRITQTHAKNARKSNINE